MAKHCGINLYTCLKSMDRTIDVCRTLRATVISLIRLGVHPAILNPIVCSKFVKQVCYPKALYGCELWGKLTSTEWLMLERTQHYICKNIQGLPRRTRSDMCLPMIGRIYVAIKNIYIVKTEGTLKPAKNFNAENDANILRKAMKGFGTDEKAIIDVLAFRSSEQRQQIRTMFKTMFGKDLIKELKSELGGKFEDCVVALMMPWDEFDAYELKRAMKGVGTDEDAMIEILCSRTNKQIQEIIATYLRTKDIQEIIATYKRLYSKKLEDDIISDTSGHFKRLMVSMASGGRMENQTVDPTKAQQDAQRLLQAGEKKLGTDESTFNAIMASQSYEQLRAVFDAYHKMAGKDIESSIKSEMSGNLEIGMLAIVRVVKNRPAYFAQKLYHSMKGLGTDDRTLIRIVVTRAEVDMVQIKQEFQRLYGKSLDTFIREDTSGDYKKVLMALVAQGGY
ncbi:annexin A7/11 [Mytilus galloprovincialis]|uniref:Annexin n=1 Tax=Mytilus galloprovincialis TaxID=29158 RepID=A0A8B6CC28_MYTGA|nr:annexin A7/11 [Mytilus galloprovincialis]